jgi:hypothetical protein
MQSPHTHTHPISRLFSFMKNVGDKLRSRAEVSFSSAPLSIGNSESVCVGGRSVRCIEREIVIDTRAMTKFVKQKLFSRFSSAIEFSGDVCVSE